MVFENHPEKHQEYVKLVSKTSQAMRQKATTGSSIDLLSPNVPAPSDFAHLIVMEDNDAVIKMLIKARTNKLPKTQKQQKSQQLMTKSQTVG